MSCDGQAPVPSSLCCCLCSSLAEATARFHLTSPHLRSNTMFSERYSTPVWGPSSGERFPPNVLSGQSDKRELESIAIVIHLFSRSESKVLPRIRVGDDSRFLAKVTSSTSFRHLQRVSGFYSTPLTHAIEEELKMHGHSTINITKRTVTSQAPYRSCCGRGQKAREAKLRHRP